MDADEGQSLRVFCPFLDRGVRIHMLTSKNTLLLIVDMQGNLARIMHEADQLFKNINAAIQGARILGVPILATEQNPAGLGPTISEISRHLTGVSIISKFSFSSCANDDFMRSIKSIDPRNILIAGIESHICVYQTTRDLLKLDYNVHVITDGVSSRTPENKKIGIKKSRQAGAEITSVETALFEMLGDAKRKEFKEILKIVK
jgi:nicotinamidase-related amidase